MLTRADQSRPLEILLIEDNPGDVRLLQEAFRELQTSIHFSVAKDGAEGIDYLQRVTRAEPEALPDLVLLDLNLPKVSGHDVLAKIKSDPKTKRLPVIVLTSSRADADIRRAYDLHANAYLRKPSTLDALMQAAEQIKTFWIECVTLPR